MIIVNIAKKQRPFGYNCNPKLTFDFHSLREMFQTILESHQSSRHKVGEMGDPLQFMGILFRNVSSV